jgi:hypothetical protein
MLKFLPILYLLISCDNAPNRSVNNSSKNEFSHITILPLSHSFKDNLITNDTLTLIVDYSISDYDWNEDATYYIRVFELLTTKSWVYKSLDYDSFNPYHPISNLNGSEEVSLIIQRPKDSIIYLTPEYNVYISYSLDSLAGLGDSEVHYSDITMTSVKFE